MKAKKKKKKFGWGWAKDVVNNQPKTDAQIFNPYNQKYSSSYNIKKGDSEAWLKRLVESHELVKDYYGLTRAKEHAESNYTAPELKAALKQAIADVESCQ